MASAKNPLERGGERSFLGRLRKLVAGRQVEIAGLVGVKQSTISAWANGTKVPVEMAAKIAAACGVSVEWLITGTAPAVLPLRVDLLADAIQQVEEEAAKMNYRMSRARAALVIAQTYADLLNEGRINRKKLVSLLRAA